MASTHMDVGTRESESAVGFIHNVSRMKISDAKKIRYFNAISQTGRDEFHNSVVFLPEFHQQFNQAAQNRTGVKLTNITRCLSDN